MMMSTTKSSFNKALMEDEEAGEILLAVYDYALGYDLKKLM